MPNNNIPGYVARYGDALRKLTGAQQSMGALGTVNASQIYDPSLGTGTGGLAQMHAQGIDNAAGTPTMSAPSGLPQQVGQADVRGALPDPAAMPSKAPTPGLSAQQSTPSAEATPEGGKTFWDVTKDLSDNEKEKITKNFEDQGVDVPAQYQKLVDEGKVDPGMVKKGKDGKIDRKDMGLFLLEFGLKTMQEASKPGATALGSMATGALSTMEGRRGRAAQDAAVATEEKRYQEGRTDKAAERSDKRKDSAEDRQLRKDLSAQEISAADKRSERETTSREKLARGENMSRERVAKMQAGKDKETFVDQTDGTVYWVDSGEPVMVKDKDGNTKPIKGKVDATKNEVTEKDIMKSVADKEAALDENITASVTIPGESAPIRWKMASPEQKEKYLETYGNTQRKRFGKQTPSGAEENPYAQWAK